MGAWLAVVARNRAIDALRRRKPSDSVDDVVLVSKTNLAAESQHKSMIEMVRKVMKALPQDQQASMELAYFEGSATLRLQHEQATRWYGQNPHQVGAHHSTKGSRSMTTADISSRRISPSTPCTVPLRQRPLSCALISPSARVPGRVRENLL